MNALPYDPILSQIPLERSSLQIQSYSEVLEFRTSIYNHFLCYHKVSACFYHATAYPNNFLISNSIF